MSFKTAEFIVSNTDYKKCPAADKPEYAFIGRSNVGKSSLINMLTNYKNLAKISSKPGKTQLINHFIVDNKWYLVDLPGYGWAQVSKSKKHQWKKMVNDYLLNRKNLYLLFILLDSRLPPQQVDMEFIRWAGEHEIPIALILTKTDKISRNKKFTLRKILETRLQEDWDQLPKIFSSSTINKAGKIEISDYIRTTSTQ